MKKKVNEELKKPFPNKQFCNPNILTLQKDVYPHKYMDDLENFN